MKLNWGYRVAILYCSFVVFMLFLVYRSSSEDFSLVTKNYYKEEIEYQQRIDKMNNSASLAQKLNIEQMSNKTVRVSFPKSFSAVSGEILLYRPSDAGKDVKIAIQPNEDMFQDVSTTSLQKGLWRVQVEWKSGEAEYFDEKPLIIQ